MNAVTIVAVLLLCVLVTESVALETLAMRRTDGRWMEWSKFKEVYGKNYSDDLEDEMRSEIFKINFRFISRHNIRYAEGQESYYLDINQFADMTHDEFMQFYTNSLSVRGEFNGSTYLSPANVAAPSTIDWRSKGYVTDVKNQGKCGSCWAFSSTGSIEGQHFRKTHNLVSLSEQQLIDCSTRYGNRGCHGGMMNSAFKYVEAAGGIESEAEYSYKGVGGTCSFVKSRVKATVHGFDVIPRGSESQLKVAVATVGPVSVAIDASKKSFQFYRGGVYNEPTCTTTNLVHAVLVVGYGTSPSDYWLVKNSWGTSWGVAGYIQMSRNKGNQCGIASEAMYPKV